MDFETTTEPSVSTETIRAMLTTTSANWRKLGANAGAWLKEEFVLRCGIDCVAAALPKRVRRGTPKHCFDNASRLVKRSKGKLRYCEGFVMVPRIGFMLFHHGWAIDSDYRVVDPTLDDPELCAYVGVPYTLDEYNAAVTAGSSAVAVGMR